MNRENVVAWLKQFPPAADTNAWWKCRQSKQQYQALTRRYATPSVLTEPLQVAKLGSQLWQGADSGQGQDGGQGGRPHVLYVGTDQQQDYSGIIQALQRSADVTIFEQEPGVYGQLWPRTPAATDAAREHNGQRLLHYVQSAGQARAIDLVIGQMWGLSMHWRSLAQVRELGIPIVNIAMDDRHAFVGRKLADGTQGGTQGLLPYLSLVCTAAPECVKWCEAEGTAAIFWPEASDPLVFDATPVAKEHDVCFVGANYGIRAQMVQMLERAGVTVRTYGNGWPNGRISVEQMPKLFAASKIVLGCGTIGYCHDFFALKMRDFDAAMSGSMYVTHANPDLAPLFREGAEIVTFKELPQLVEIVRHYLKAEAEREQIAAAGALRARREHSWDARFELMLERLSALPGVSLKRERHA